ncbi:Lysosomal Cystine Transporter (LCT) Family [Thraustotheca clavata]|uniref:Lysosomal Cystine Transporter (LCT) Family n=1 Tax=Thraustotheca clavata TaxID=74557 RepID=A0A1V9ZX09_9STRA|nr:Lysosomal Cystine Transporter (LCT) Family [Thraustotheca clavata]
MMNEKLSKLLISLEPYGASIGIGIILGVGVVLGFALDGNDNVPAPFNRISSVIGWMYFAAWSMTFWPQIFVNWRRQSVVGMAIEFQVYNIPGFVGYTVYNACFYWNTKVQEEYKALHNGNPNNVQINDVFFAIHALIATLITLYQCLVYHRGTQTVSMTCWVLTGLSIFVCVVFYFMTLLWPTSQVYTMLNFLYLLSYIKLGVTLIKYTPQVYLNYQRESTEGYSIWGVLFDVLGGVLSIGQIIMDSATTDDWSAITGNPVKFALGLVVVFYDFVFMIQHFILYPCGEAVDIYILLMPSPTKPKSSSSKTTKAPSPPKAGKKDDKNAISLPKINTPKVATPKEPSNKGASKFEKMPSLEKNELILQTEAPSLSIPIEAQQNTTISDTILTPTENTPQQTLDSIVSSSDEVVKAEIIKNQNGNVVLKYEMYEELFPIVNGSTTMANIDDIYALTFVMPNCLVHLSKYDPTTKLAMESTGNLDLYVKEDPVGTYQELEADCTYYVYVEQEGEQLAKDQEKMRQVAATMDGKNWKPPNTTETYLIKRKMDVVAATSALEAFAKSSQTQQDYDANPLLEAIIQQIKMNGILRYDWQLVRVVYLFKLKCVLSLYSTFTISKEVENQRDLVLTKMEIQEEAPFTLQRLTEVLVAPMKYYKILRKLLNAVEKLLFVSSTLDQHTDTPSGFKAYIAKD